MISLLTAPEMIIFYIGTGAALIGGIIYGLMK